MMQFANPWFLIALSAIAIPVLIHLFNFRRFRKVYFTNVRFIEELKLQTQKQSKLKHLLILLARIMTIIMLVLAFAQPYRPLNRSFVQQHALNSVSVYIDNSFSMEAKGRQGSLLDEARQKTTEILAAHKPADQFHLLTTDFEGRHQRWINREELQGLLPEITFSPASRPLNTVIARQQDMFQSASSNKNIFILSDFQKSTTLPEMLSPDTSANIFLLPLQARQSENLFIDSCWFESPVQQLNQLSTLHVRIRNAGNTVQEKIPVKLMINDLQRAIASVNCNASSSAEVRLSFTNQQAGVFHAMLSLTDYPVTYDDDFYFTFTVQSRYKVLCINEKEPNVYLDNLFGRDSAFQYLAVNVKSLDYSSVSDNNLVIISELQSFPSGLTQALQALLEQGGSVCVIPPENPDQASWAGFLNQYGLGSFRNLDTIDLRVRDLDPSQLLFREVFDKIPENLDLPRAFSHLPLVFPAASQANTILALDNDDPFLVSYNMTAGTMYLFTAALRESSTNFGKHVLFVPTMYRMALLSLPNRPLFYYIGQDQAIPVQGSAAKGDDVFRIKQLGHDYDFIPENSLSGSKRMLFVHNQIRQAGNYSLTDGGREIAGLAFNYDRQESVLDFYNADELKELVRKAGLKHVHVLDATEKPLTQLIEDLNRGVRYWKLFAFLALLFIAAEIGMLRFWKTS